MEAEPRNRWLNFLHLATLSSLVIAQPVFSLLADNPQFFLVRGATLSTLAVFLAFTFALAPVFLFLLVTVCSLIHPTAGNAAYRGSVFALILVGVLQVLNQLIPVSGDNAVLIAAPLALIFCALYFRHATMQSIVTVMSIAVVLCPALFLFQYWQNVYSKETTTTQAPVAQAPAPFVMVVFDELPLSILLDESDQIDQSRFPNFARLANTSTWYPNASTVSDNTSLAVPAMMSSTLPNLTGLSRPPSPTYADFPRNLFTLLRATHNLNVYESISRLCPDDLCNKEVNTGQIHLNHWRTVIDDTLIVFLHMALPEGMRNRLPSLNLRWGGFRVGAHPLDRDAYNFKPKAVSRFSRSVKSSKGTDFHFLHAMLPHVPWRFYPDGTAYDKRGGHTVAGLGADYIWHDDPHHLRIAFWRQSMQVEYVDKLLGKIIAAMKQSPNYDNMLLVITSDHGSNISASEHFRFAKDGDVRELMAVPLFVKLPKQHTGEISYRNVQLIDILPTVIDLMDIEVDWPIIGTSLLSDPTSNKKVLVSPSHLREDKYIYHLTLQRDERLVAHHPLLATSSYRTSSPALEKLPELISRPVSDFQVVTADSVGYVRAYSEFDRVRLKSNFLPGLVSIRDEPAPETSAPAYAISLNGLIVATATPQFDRLPGFDVLLPKNAFKEGKNKLGVFRIRKNEDNSLTLAALEIISESP